MFCCHCWLITESCLTLGPHGLQPARLLCPWNSPGKNPGVGRHFLLQWTTFCQNSSLWPVCLGWPCAAWLITSLSFANPFTRTRLWPTKGALKTEAERDKQAEEAGKQQMLTLKGFPALGKQRLQIVWAICWLLPLSCASHFSLLTAEFRLQEQGHCLFSASAPVSRRACGFWSAFIHLFEWMKRKWTCKFLNEDSLGRGSLDKG